eukprot:3669706-Pleurochrysis_carterae.AAC.1
MARKDTQSRLGENKPCPPLRASPSSPAPLRGARATSPAPASPSASPAARRNPPVQRPDAPCPPWRARGRR